jgi:glycosyltransferase involved in cell wall biosynthesis
MGIHQILVAASPGDAVTNAAFSLRDLLRRVGPSEIYARYLDPRLAEEVVPLTEFDGRGDDLLIYHASVGEPAVVAFLLQRTERLVLLYHNITPAQYFRKLDPDFAYLLATGRIELAVLRERVSLALAVSAYNAAELEALGYEDVRISPLPIDSAVMGAASADAEMVDRLEREMKGPLILFVGQLLPHKRPDLLLQAYHVLVTYQMPEARLALVGGGRSEVYRRALEEYIGELQLAAWITGWVSDRELTALYRKASVFVTMSEHEGVCVPLVESMAHGVPVIARRWAAIPETMGDAGLLLPPEDDPVLAAEAIHAVLTDQALATDLSARGNSRLRAFDLAAAQATFLSHLADAV